MKEALADSQGLLLVLNKLTSDASGMKRHSYANG
jgi:hypothetical protein